MTLLDGVRLGAQRPRWEKLPVDVVSTAGAEAVGLAASAGLILDDWQSWWLNQALSERADGDWCARENVLITGRQSGKNGVLAALELFYLFVMNDELVIHSAHELPTAINHFHFLLSVIDRTPDLSRKCKKPTFTNGAEAINLSSGATLKFRARGKNSGRGLTAARLVLDEAFKIPAEAMGALLPTLRAVPNTQITYASSAPKSDSRVLWSLINRGRADDAKDRLFYAEWGNPLGTDISSVDAWYQANPALGIRITEETLHDEYRTLVTSGDMELVAEFAREAVGIGQPLPEDSAARDAKLPADAWTATITHHPPPIAPGEIVLAFDIAPGGEWASVAMAAGALDTPYVEVIEHRAGTGWLPSRLVELVERWKPQHVVCDGVGPAGSTIAAVLLAFRQAGITADLLHQVTITELKRACGAFFADVVEGRLKRPPNQGPLENAAADATERRLGEAWAWDRRNATVPISPLVAVTLARSMLSAESPVDDHQFQGGFVDLADFLDD